MRSSWICFSVPRATMAQMLPRRPAPALCLVVPPFQVDGQLAAALQALLKDRGQMKPSPPAPGGPGTQGGLERSCGGASQGESGLGLVCIHSIQSQGLGVPRSLQPLDLWLGRFRHDFMLSQSSGEALGSGTVRSFWMIVNEECISPGRFT